MTMLGTYSADNETFTVTEGLKFSPTFKTTLPAPITFTLTD